MGELSGCTGKQLCVKGVNSLRIAVDCMGADNSPQALVAGALMAAAEEKQITVVLVGPQPLIEREVSESGIDCSFEIVHASDVISNEDQAALAVRRKRESSLVRAAKLVKEGKADVLLTAGSTGAFLAAGLLIVGRLPGIRRPALAPVIPSFTGTPTVLLDVGANMDATPEDLYNYALMGSLYAGQLLNKERPEVALLNVGTEAGKGNTTVKAAFERLSQSQVNFIGNIEARELLETRADVVVCDGFVGNVALKLMEGVAATLIDVLKKELSSNWRAKIGGLLALPSLKGLKSKMDYSEYGGAPLLGLKSPCFKCHGSSDSSAVKHGVLRAVSFVRAGIIPELERRLKQENGGQ